MATISVSMVRALVDAVERAGHDGRALLAAAGIPDALLEDPEARIDGQRYDRVQRLALATTGDPALGLHAGETASASAFSAAGQMASHCGTLREALEVLFNYYRLVGDPSPPRLVEEGQFAHIVYEIVRSPDPLCNRLRQEFGVTLTSAIAIASFRCDSLGRDTEVWFEHGRPAYAAEYSRIFRGRERFDRPHAGFVIRRALLGDLLQARQVHRDPQLFRLLKRRADEWMVRLDTNEGLAGKVRRTIVDAFPDAPIALDAVARRLGVSGRVLRRRLQVEGHSFQSVVSMAMRDLACALLGERDITIQEAAHRLGFSDPSAFHRAFKRWTGVTPGQWRRSTGV